MATCAIVSFRPGLSGGVSVVAARWGTILERLGYDVVTVAGQGPVDRLLEGLAIGAPEPSATADVAAVLAGRPAVLHHPAPSAADIYAAADVVVFTSLWEGFGNPPVEAAVWGRPAVVSHYPVAAELRALGFGWFDPDDLHLLREHLATGDAELLRHNRRVVEQHLSMEVIGDRIAALLAEMGLPTAAPPATSAAPRG